MNRRNLLLVLFICLIAGLAALASLPAAPPPILLAVTPAAEQVKFLRHLELGAASEDQGQWSQAESEYRAAALAEDVTIAQAGRENYKRLAAFQQSPLYKIQSSLQWMLSPLPWLALLLVSLVVAILFSPRPVSYHVFAFNDVTKDQAGKSLHLLVIRKLEAVREAYRRAREELILDMQRFNLPAQAEEPDPFTDLIAALGTQEFGPVAVPIDKLKNIFEKWRDRNENQLNGHFYQSENTCYLDARVTRTGKLVDQWPLMTIGPAGSAIEAFQSELAYRFLALILGEKTKFQSWESLRAWSEGLMVYQQAPTDRALLQQAAARLSAAQAKEPGSREIAFLLGMIDYRLERYADARGALARVIYGSEQSDDLSLLATVRLAETRYLEFDPENFKTAENEFGEIVHVLHGRTQNERQKQIEALALCGQAVILAHWMHGGQNLDEQMERVSELRQMALKLAGESSEVRAACNMALGIAETNRGRPKEAMDSFKDVLQIRRDYPAALIRMASVQADTVTYRENPQDGLDEQAIMAYENGEIDHLEEILREIDGRAAEGIALFTESIERGLPGREYAVRKLSALYTSLGRVRVKTISLERGLKDYEQAVVIDPENADAWDNTAYRIVETFQARTAAPTEASRTPTAIQALLDQAAASARKAICLAAAAGSPREAHYRATLAEVLIEQGDFSGAQQEIDQASALHNVTKQERTRLQKIRVKIQRRKEG